MTAPQFTKQEAKKAIGIIRSTRNSGKRCGFAVGRLASNAPVVAVSRGSATRTKILLTDKRDNDEPYGKAVPQALKGVKLKDKPEPLVWGLCKLEPQKDRLALAIYTKRKVDGLILAAHLRNFFKKQFQLPTPWGRVCMRPLDSDDEQDSDDTASATAVESDQSSDEWHDYPEDVDDPEVDDEWPADDAPTGASDAAPEPNQPSDAPPASQKTDSPARIAEAVAALVEAGQAIAIDKGFLGEGETPNGNFLTRMLQQTLKRYPDRPPNEVIEEITGELSSILFSQSDSLTLRRLLGLPPTPASVVANADTAGGGSFSEPPSSSAAALQAAPGRAEQIRNMYPVIDIAQAWVPGSDEENSALVLSGLEESQTVAALERVVALGKKLLQPAPYAQVVQRSASYYLEKFSQTPINSDAGHDLALCAVWSEFTGGDHGGICWQAYQTVAEKVRRLHWERLADVGTLDLLNHAKMFENQNCVAASQRLNNEYWNRTRKAFYKIKQKITGADKIGTLLETLQGSKAELPPELYNLAVRESSNKFNTNTDQLTQSFASDVSAFASLCHEWFKLAETTPGYGGCAVSCRRVAARVSALDSDGLKGLSTPDLTVFATTFGASTRDENCATAMRKLCGEVCQRAELDPTLSYFDLRDKSLLLNTLRPWLRVPECQEAFLAIAEAIGKHEEQLDRFNMIDIALSCNAMSGGRLLEEVDFDESERMMLQRQIQRLAARVVAKPDILQGGSVRNISMFLRVLGDTGLREDLDAIRQPAIACLLNAGVAQADPHTLHILSQAMPDLLGVRFPPVPATGGGAVDRRNPPAEFDIQQAFGAMRHPPRPPSGGAGLMNVPVVDITGRPVEAVDRKGDPIAGKWESDAIYSIFSRLTGGQVPIVSVRLPLEVSSTEIEAPVKIDGVPYRGGLFGGSGIKREPETLSSIFSDDRQEKARHGGHLLAVPDHEVDMNTSFGKFLVKNFKHREDASRFKQFFMAGTPKFAGTTPQDYVLEGAFKLGVLPDPAGEARSPFQITDRDGNVIAIHPEDGCGFIKLSLLEKFPAMQKIRDNTDNGEIPAFGARRPARLPAQAFQHFPASEAVGDEIRQKIEAKLGEMGDTPPDLETIFRMMTAGGVEGANVLAVPSSDDYLHLPALKSGDIDPNGSNVLIGRSPHDEPHLYPFSADKVRTSNGADPTGRFLDQCVAIQTRSVMQQEDPEAPSAMARSMLMSKNVLIGVRDEDWPQAFADRDMMMTESDIKIYTNRDDTGDRPGQYEAINTVGMLQVVDVCGGGSAVAIPKYAQKTILGGDWDGDKITVVSGHSMSGYPALFAHIQAYEKRRAPDAPSLKPAKTRTSALDPETGAYDFSRVPEIIATKRMVLENYSGKQSSFLAQPFAQQQWLAERAVFGTYEGLGPSLGMGLRDLLADPAPAVKALEDLLALANTDLENSRGRPPAARQAQELLVKEIRSWHDSLATGEPDGRRTTDDDADAGLAQLYPELAEIFPELPQRYDTAGSAQKHLEAVLTHYPERMDLGMDCDPNDLINSFVRFLSYAIKAGTDAFKADTGMDGLEHYLERLDKLMSEIPRGLRPVPQSKRTARKMKAGTFDPAATLGNLEGVNSLGASISAATIPILFPQ
jgi:hypothetical protein